MKAAPVAPVRGRLLRARGAAEYLGLSEYKARALIRTGDLIAVRATSGRLEGVYVTDCDAWIAAHRSAAARPVTVSVDDQVRRLLPAERRFM